jgi:uncharacterized protein
VAGRPPGEIEFGRPRRATAARLLVAVLFLGAAAAIVAWQLGWLHLPARPAPVSRVEESLPSPPPAAAASPAAQAADTPADAAAPTTAPAPDTPPSESATTAPAPEPAPPAAELASSAPPEPAAAPSSVEAALPPPPVPPAVAAPAPPAAAPATEQAMLEPGPNGPLPIIAPDGREAWRVYARPFDRTDKRSRLAIVVFGLGLSAAPTETSIKDLPGAVTLAFEPYARQLPEWVERAHAAGHEILLSVPMEPADYPRQDPGPYTLLTSLDAKENVRRLDWVLSRATGYVGVANIMGARFSGSRTGLLPVLEELRKRGLMFVDGRPAEQSAAESLAGPMALPHVTSDRTLDADATREAIDRRLSELEDVARRRGAALGVGFIYPVTVARVAAWAKTLEQKGLVLAPVSALGALPGAGK